MSEWTRLPTKSPNPTVKSASPVVETGTWDRYEKLFRGWEVPGRRLRNAHRNTGELSAQAHCGAGRPGAGAGASVTVQSRRLRPDPCQQEQAPDKGRTTGPGKVKDTRFYASINVPLVGLSNAI